MSRRKLAISFLIGTAISLAFLYISFKNVPLAGLSGYLASINYWWFIPITLILVLGMVLRAVRWRIILHPVARLSFWECFHPMMIGFMMNCILPARVGEFARPAILRQKHGATFFGVLATVAAERVLDLLGLLVMLILTMKAVGGSFPGKVEFAGYVLTQATLDTAVTAMIRTAAVLVAGIVAVSITPLRVLMEKAVMASPSALVFLPARVKEKIRERLCKAVVGIMERIAAGFSLIKSPAKLFWCSILTAGVWVLTAFTYIIAAKASPGINIGWIELTASMVIICFFISAPSAPGFWGLWEAGGIFALAVFGITDRTAAAGFTLAVHIINMLPSIAIGFVSAGVMGVNVLKISGDEGSAEESSPCAR